MKKDKVKEYAKDLYLSYNDDGSKSYSFRDIAQKVKQKFNKSCTFNTIRNWAIKGNWDKLNEKIKQHSISKAKNEKFTTEEKVVELKSDDLGQTYKYATQLEQISVKVAIDHFKNKPHESISFRDSLQGFKYAVDIKMRINDIPEMENEKQEQKQFYILGDGTTIPF